MKSKNSTKNVDIAKTLSVLDIIFSILLVFQLRFILIPLKYTAGIIKGKKTKLK